MKTIQFCSAAAFVLLSASTAFAQSTQGSMDAPAPMPPSAQPTSPGAGMPDTAPSQPGMASPNSANPGAGYNANSNDMGRAPATTAAPARGDSGYGAGGMGSSSYGASGTAGSSASGSGYQNYGRPNPLINANDVHAAPQLGAQDNQLYRGN